MFLSFLRARNKRRILLYRNVSFFYESNRVRFDLVETYIPGANLRPIYRVTTYFVLSIFFSDRNNAASHATHG